MKNYKELWQSVFDDTYKDKFDYHFDGYVLTGGGGNYPSYDLTLAKEVILTPEYPFCLSSAREHFNVPSDIMLLVCNKSTIARLGVNASCCTFIDNGFKGDLTLEIMSYNSSKAIFLPEGLPIVQVVAIPLMFQGDVYKGKYQNQTGTTGAK